MTIAHGAIVTALELLENGGPMLPADVIDGVIDILQRGLECDYTINIARPGIVHAVVSAAIEMRLPPIRADVVAAVVRASRGRAEPDRIGKVFDQVMRDREREREQK